MKSALLCARKWNEQTVNEMTQETSGVPENAQVVWPTDEQMRTLSETTAYSFEDYYYLRRYLTLDQMRRLARAAAAQGIDRLRQYAGILAPELASC